MLQIKENERKRFGKPPKKGVQMIENTFTMEDSLFKVKEVPAMKGTDKDTGYKFVVREDNGDILSCMTNSYKTISNNDIMSKAEPVLAEKRCSFDRR